MSIERAMNVKTLGQVFTPADIVERMLSLRRNNGSILEPAAGDGAFLRALEAHAVGIEIDRAVVHDKRTIVCDFFGYSTDNKFATVIGNPPYVRFQDIGAETKTMLPMEWFDRRTNLYLFFIAKAMAHLEVGGEMIFITPRDFLKSTNAKTLNKNLYDLGTITHFYDLGDAKVFHGFSPNCAIWRWQRGMRNRKTAMGNAFCHRHGQLWFGENPSGATVGDYFDVKVGAVSGADRIFSHHDHANVSMVCSRTRKHGVERKMIYNRKCKYLNQFKAVLLKRRIRQFDESNWWQWGRAYHCQPGPRIYVNAKTRTPSPFFISETEPYDGSVLALFPKDEAVLGRAVEKLNSMDWDALGFVCGGRLLFTQNGLQNACIGDLS